MSKLLLLTSSFPRWNGDFVGNFVLEFAQAISSNYEEIFVLAPASQNAPTEESWGKLKITRFNYFWPKSLQILDSAVDLQPLLETSIFAKLQLIPFCLAFFCKAFYLAKKSDFICAHWLLPSGLIASFLSLLLKKPLLIVEHSGALNLLCKLPIGSFLLNIIGQNAQSIVLVSRELQNKLIKLCPNLKNKTSVISMGIDCSFYRSISKPISKEKKILFLGRLTKIKGVDILIKALANCQDIKLLVAGDGEERVTLERLSTDLQVPTKFLGTVTGKEKLELIQSCDLVVVPSIVLPDGRTEGTPVVCLEAFACGKPVIASSVGGLSDLVTEGKLGFLFEPGDETVLKEKIFLLLADEEMQRRMSILARKEALNYDWQIIGKQFNLLINNV